MAPGSVIEIDVQPHNTNSESELSATKGSFFFIRGHNIRLELGLVVDTKFAYIPLLLCCFVSGLTDSTVYSAYNTFVSMQTGNSIFFALGASGQNDKPCGWAAPLCSMGCFIVGSLVYARLSGFLGGRRRGAMVSSFSIQTICVVLAAAVTQSGLVNGAHSPYHPHSEIDVDWKELIPIALLSFQAAGQIVSSRALGVSEIPTVVITSLLCDLMSDASLLAPIGANPKRNKRIAAFILTLAGGICGGWIFKATGTVEVALWGVAGIKLLVTFAWFFWTPEDRPS